MRQPRSHDRTLNSARVSAAVAAILFAFGCGQKIKPPQLAAYPVLQELINDHNQRVQALAKTHSQGVIELNWKDADGKHFEQAGLDMWISLPLHTAVRVEKFSEVILWLGSNDQQWWLFDLISKEKTLVTGSHAAVDGGAQAGAFGVRPAALVDLMGLTPIEPSNHQGERPGYDATSDTWIVDTVGKGGAIRVHFHRKQKLPIRVESLDSSGRVVVRSRLAINRYESVRLPGVSAMGSPRMPGQIDVEALPSNLPVAESGTAPIEGRVKIALNETTGIVDEAEMVRVFDLERLQQAMRVDRVEPSP